MLGHRRAAAWDAGASVRRKTGRPSSTATEAVRQPDAARVFGRFLDTTRVFGRGSDTHLALGRFLDTAAFSGEIRTPSAFSGGFWTSRASSGEIRSFLASKMAKCRPTMSAASGCRPKTKENEMATPLHQGAAWMGGAPASIPRFRQQQLRCHIQAIREALQFF